VMGIVSIGITVVYILLLLTGQVHLSTFQPTTTTTP